VSDETELRLTGGKGRALSLAWFHQVSEEKLAELSVPRAAYDRIVADADTWEPLRAKFEGVFFVDLRRLIAGREVAAAA
jgi:hypothetical protein